MRSEVHSPALIFHPEEIRAGYIYAARLFYHMGDQRCEKRSDPFEPEKKLKHAWPFCSKINYRSGETGI